MGMHILIDKMALMVISMTLLLLGICGKASGAECGGEYSTVTGTISHPAAQSGTYYENNQHCTWIIKSTAPLYFHFSKFTTENKHDSVLVRDGSTVVSSLINKFSGKSVHSTFITTGDAYIQFASDSNVVGTGFVLHWKLWSAEEQCKEINGFCVQSGDKCDGSISLIRNNCNDKCVCCVKPVVPEPDLGDSISLKRILHSINQELHEVSLIANGGVAKASSSHSTRNYEPMEAFENGGFWHSGVPYDVLPQTLWVEFPNPIRVVEYSFTSRTDQRKYVATDGPSKYIFWASNSNDCQNVSSWVILKEDNTGIAFKSNNDPKMVVIENKYFYRCYGFKVNDVPGRDGITPVSIGNVHLYSDIELHDVSLTAYGGIAKASSSHSTGNYEPMEAFKKGSFWHSGVPYDVLPQTLWVEFADPIRIVKYSFTSRTDQMQYIATDGPSKYIFWASNSDDCQDASKWVILKEDDTGVAFKSSDDPKIVVIANNMYTDVMVLRLMMYLDDMV